MTEPDTPDLSDIESDDIPQVRKRMRICFPVELRPGLPIEPQVWKRIARWYAQGAPTIFLRMLTLYMGFCSPGFNYADMDFLEYRAQNSIAES